MDTVRKQTNNADTCWIRYVVVARRAAISSNAEPCIMKKLHTRLYQSHMPNIASYALVHVADKNR